MKTVAKWYPTEKEITYNNEKLDGELKKNPGRILVPNIDSALALRRNKFYLTEVGKVRFKEIRTDLAKQLKIDAGEITFKYDLHCGCRCSCSPGFRIIADIPRYIYLRILTY